jgi:NTP pyrophosphatase (non-canonical NTP hydrolase)
LAADDEDTLQSDLSDLESEILDVALEHGYTANLFELDNSGDAVEVEVEFEKN